MDVDGHLARHGLARPAEPTVQWLVAAHRAQVERVQAAYEASLQAAGEGGHVPA